MEFPPPSGLSIAFKCWLQIPKLYDRKTKKPRTLARKLEVTPHWKITYEKVPLKIKELWIEKIKAKIQFVLMSFFPQNLITKYLTDISHY